MLTAQSLYAPEPAALWEEDRVCIGRRLFRTLPEDVFDRGPIVGGGGRLALVADIRLDDREELAAALGLAPAEAAALADSALLMKAWERWQERAVERLVGDFAFALWDGAARRLVLARDFLGQRPLHYHRGDGFFAFASMPKGLHALPQVPRRPDAAAVADFLALLPESGSGTFFEGIERVPPGHVVSVTADGAAARRYWRPSLEPLRLRRPEDYVEAVRDTFDAAVAARLRGAGTTIGAHLSAGLDSGGVAATAARLLAPSGGRVVAFTSVPRPGYDAPSAGESFGDEGPLAAATAALYANIVHVPIRTTGASPLDGLDRGFQLFERPYLNIDNAMWLNAINDAARQRGLHVMMMGVMGNMTFSYNGMEALPEMLRRGRLLRLSRLVLQLVSRGARWGTVGAQTLGPFLPEAVWKAIMRLRGRSAELHDYSALSPQAAERHAVAARAEQRGLDFSYRPRTDGAAMRLWVLGRVDPGNYHKGMLGGWGLDSRDPTADRRLVELCLRIPSEEYVRGGVPRGLARRVLADRLPPEVVGQMRKGYQAIDWHENLAAHREGLAHEVARIAACDPAAETLDTAMMRRLLDDWPTDGWHRMDRIQPYRLALLRGLSAGHFLRKATGSNA